MDVENLVHMANRIGDFFQAMPDRQEAKDGIVLHIRKFWEPRMRRQLFAHLDSAHPPELMPLVREAVTEQRAKLEPAPAPAQP